MSLTKATYSMIEGAPINVLDFGAVADGGVGNTDNKAAFDAAFAAALATGNNAVVIPSAPLPFGFSGVLSVPDGVALRGVCYNGRDNLGAGLLCLSANAQIKFGGQGSANAHFSGAIGEFYIDGNAVATDPLYFGRGSDKFIQNIVIRNTAAGGTAIRIEESQNFIFTNVRPIDSIGGKGWVFDRGTGGHILIGCNSNDTADYGVYITETWGGGLAEGLYAQPTHINFYETISERDSTGKQLYIGAGTDIGFHACVFASNSSSAPVNLIGMTVESGRAITRIRFHDCILFGSQTYTTGFLVGNGASVILTGRTRLNSLLTGFNIVSGANIDIKDYAASAVTTAFAGTGSADTYARFRLMQPLEITRLTSTEQAVVFANGTTGVYRRDRADGRIDWGDGSGFSFDTNLYRGAADRLETSDLFYAIGGVIPGVAANTATVSATSPPNGTVRYVTDGDSGSPCLAVRVGSSWLRIPLGAAISP